MTTSSFSLFKGLCPVRVPFSWVADPNGVRWAAEDSIQYIDFSANGGPALAFSISGTASESGVVPEHWQSVVNPQVQEIDPSTVQSWGDRESGAPYAEAHITSQIFGTSAQVIDLVPPEPDDGVEVFPPATIAGVQIDTATPVRYYWCGDNYGGCGFFYAFVRTADGSVLEASIGMEVEWQRPYLYEGATHEEYILIRSEARKNPNKIRSKDWRELQARDTQFDKDVFVV